MFTKFLLLIFELAACAAASHLPTAHVHDGTLIGTTTSLPAATATVNKFLGVPYADSPPVRFAPPSPAKPWPTPRNASKFGDACIQQTGMASDFIAGESSQSEDCLYLNVFQPSGTPPGKGWPVMVWIHGGGFKYGSGDVPKYDGAKFAAYEGVVFVSFNYRLSVFGFPGAPNLPNLGFLDQRYALTWVQSNIRAFNGDPAQVTVFGESSGGISVDSLLVVPPAKLPFRAAIIQSGTVLSNVLASLGQDPASSWNRTLAAFNCTAAPNAVDCMRMVPALAIQSFAVNASLPTVITSDNVTYNTHGGRRRAAGAAANVPVMVGSTANEGRLLTLGQTNLSDFINSTFAQFASLRPELEKAYAVGTPGINSESQAIAQLFTEIGLQCPAALLAQQVTQAGSPAWRYIFNATFANTSPLPVDVLGAFHSSELPLVFSTYNETTATAQEYALSNYMRGAWARFARDPAAGPGWGAVGSFNGTDLGLLGLDGSSGVTVVSPSAAGIDSRCELYDDVYKLLA